ncbi:hypothetical protein CCACVL1_30431 [Corchorus capsularis]|uniref:Uncharacterized protein n=1 Tax=Corchorus capsularis TaxID=210143 RepID=A0A1R3FX82_COCAP|nr:hypothetical protein CCACVL1_30431 [Corchorus capsularis]
MAMMIEIQSTETAIRRSMVTGAGDS